MTSPLSCALSCAIALGIMENSSKWPLSTPSGFGRIACPATNPISAAPITHTGTIVFLFMPPPHDFQVRPLLPFGLRCLQANFLQEFDLFLQLCFSRWEFVEAQ